MRTKSVSVFLLISCIISLPVLAQQRPQYTQYIFNNYIINPALTGIENYTDVKLGYRNQWQGLDGAPKTSYISIHAPLGKNFINGDATSVPESGGSNPMNRSFVQTYRASEPHHGIGFHAVTDQAGPLSSMYLNLTYAYHIGINENTNLSFGVAGGISKLNLDISKVKTDVEIDPAISGQINNRLQPDLGAGIWLYGPTYFAGLSAQSLLGRTITFTNNNAPYYGKGKEIPHLFFSAGYKFFLGEDIAAIPSTMIKYVTPAPLTIDLNLKVAFQDKFWIGASYRKNDAVAAMLGFNVSSLFNVSYSYDYTTSNLNTVSNGSHEIVLGLLLNNRYKVTCPQKNW